MTPTPQALVRRSPTLISRENLGERLDDYIEGLDLAAPGSADLARSEALLHESENAAEHHEYGYSAVLARIGTGWALLAHARIAAEQDARAAALSGEVRALQRRLTAAGTVPA